MGDEAHRNSISTVPDLLKKSRYDQRQKPPGVVLSTQVGAYKSEFVVCRESGTPKKIPFVCLTVSRVVAAQKHKPAQGSSEL